LLQTCNCSQTAFSERKSTKISQPQAPPIRTELRVVPSGIDKENKSLVRNLKQGLSRNLKNIPVKTKLQTGQ
jgi:hypothetical protein